MFWSKWKKKKIKEAKEWNDSFLPFKKPKTLEEVAQDGKVGDTYYFRIEQGKVEELVLYAKTPIGYNTTRYKLPLSPTFITKISTKCNGNKSFWEKEMIKALRNHWRKFQK